MADRAVPVASVPGGGHRTGGAVRPRAAGTRRAVLGGGDGRLGDAPVGRVRVLPRAVVRRVCVRAAGRVRETSEQVPGDGAAARGGDGQGENVPVPADGRRTAPVGVREKDRQFPSLTSSVFYTRVVILFGILHFLRVVKL